MRPAQLFAGQRHFVVAQRRAVRVMGASFVRRAEADNGFAHQQRRFVAYRFRFVNRLRDSVRVVAVYAAHHVPAVGFKALRGIVGEPAVDMTVDRDAVVVIEGDQFAQLQGAGKRADFVRDAFHHAAVAHKHIGVVIDDIVAWTVELRRQRALGDGEADRVGDALAQRAGSGFHAWGVAVFRVTWSF